MELKTQSLPVKYTDHIDKYIQEEVIKYSLLERILLNQDSYFYILYKSDTSFSVKASSDTEYIIPASENLMEIQIFFEKGTMIDSFIISPKTIESYVEFFESGLIGTDSGLKQNEVPLIRYKKDTEINILYNSDDKNNKTPGMLIVLNSNETSTHFNTEVQINKSIDYLIKPRSGLNHYWFYNKEGNPNFEMDIVLAGSQLVDIELGIENTKNDAKAIDLEELVYWNQDTWRQPEYELFRWDLFFDMLIIDTDSYEIQSSFFKRLAYFTEKKGFAGELSDDEILGPLHGWNAHDYRADDLARFFNEAQKTSFILNAYELQLKELLLENEVLRKSGDRVRSIKGGILSISRDSSERLRWLFLTHECYHGVFFSSDDYVARVTEIWNGLAEEEREFWRIFLSMYGYNIFDEYLLINEFQAYLMQQNINLADSYFRGKINWILGIKPYLEGSMNTLLSDYGDTFSRSAKAVENAAYTLTGIRAGDLVLKRKK